MQPASSKLQKLVGDLLRRSPIEDAAVNAWPMVCGSAIAVRTRALAFRDGSLFVEVPEKSWRAELVQFLPQYLSAMNRLLPARVEKIVFTLPGERMPEANQ